MVSGVEPFRLQEQSNTAFLGHCLAKVRVNYWLPYFRPVILANEIKRTSDRNFIRTIDLARWRRSWSVENPVNSSEKNSLLFLNRNGRNSNSSFTQELIVARSSSLLRPSVLRRASWGFQQRACLYSAITSRCHTVLWVPTHQRFTR